MKPSFRLKCLSGWFAAGPEFERALKLLSEGAFKLFAFVCLHADRPSGRLDFDRKELARCLGKSRCTLSRQLLELDYVGICKLATAPNQHHAPYLIVSEAYWPYCCEPQPVVLPADAALQAYVCQGASSSCALPVCRPSSPLTTNTLPPCGSRQVFLSKPSGAPGYWAAFANP